MYEKGATETPWEVLDKAYQEALNERRRRRPGSRDRYWGKYDSLTHLVVFGSQGVNSLTQEVIHAHGASIRKGLTEADVREAAIYGFSIAGGHPYAPTKLIRNELQSVIKIKGPVRRLLGR